MAALPWPSIDSGRGVGVHLLTAGSSWTPGIVLARAHPVVIRLVVWGISRTDVRPSRSSGSAHSMFLPLSCRSILLDSLSRNAFNPSRGAEPYVCALGSRSTEEDDPLPPPPAAQAAHNGRGRRDLQHREGGSSPELGPHRRPADQDVRRTGRPRQATDVATTDGT